MKNNKNKAGKTPANIRFDIPPLDEQERMVEAILFAASEPQTAKQMLTRLPQGCDVGGRRFRHCKPAIKTEAFAWLKSAMAGRFAPPPIWDF